MHEQPRLVVISGCSAGGKSTLIQALAERGCAVAREPGRAIVEAEQARGGDALPWRNPLAFLGAKGQQLLSQFYGFAAQFAVGQAGVELTATGVEVGAGFTLSCIVQGICQSGEIGCPVIQIVFGWSGIHLQNFFPALFDAISRQKKSKYRPCRYTCSQPVCDWGPLPTRVPYLRTGRSQLLTIAERLAGCFCIVLCCHARQKKYYQNQIRHL